jgi:hypothetical protein
MPDLASAYYDAAIGRLSTDRQLVELMKCVRRYVHDHPEVLAAVIGGEVIITEVSQASVNSRIVYKFEDYEQIRHAAAAVLARIEAGLDEVDIESGVWRVDDGGVPAPDN